MTSTGESSCRGVGGGADLSVWPGSHAPPPSPKREGDCGKSRHDSRAPAHRRTGISANARDDDIEARATGHYGGAGLHCRALCALWLADLFAPCAHPLSEPGSRLEDEWGVGGQMRGPPLFPGELRSGASLEPPRAVRFLITPPRSEDVTESTATVAQDLQRVAAAAASPRREAGASRRACAMVSSRWRSRARVSSS